VDSRERLRDDKARAEIAGLQRGVFAGGALAVVVLRDDEPGLVLGFPLLGEVGDGVSGAIDVEGLVRGAGLGVDGADEGVFGDVGEVAFEFEPGAGGGDGVCCALAFDFEEDFEGGEFLGAAGGVGGPGLEGFEEGEAGGGWADFDFGAGVGLDAVGSEDWVAGGEALAREVLTDGRLEAEALA